MVFGTRTGITQKFSLGLGAVRLAESEKSKEFSGARQRAAIRARLIRSFPADMRQNLRQTDQLFVSGGTATTLAWLESGDHTYEAERIDGSFLTRTAVGRLVAALSRMTLTERKKALFLDPNRADIIIPGALILQALMGCSGLRQLIVSDRGLRFGIVLRETGLSLG